MYVFLKLTIRVMLFSSFSFLGCFELSLEVQCTFCNIGVCYFLMLSIPELIFIEVLTIENEICYNVLEKRKSIDISKTKVNYSIRSRRELTTAANTQ